MKLYCQDRYGYLTDDLTDAEGEYLVDKDDYDVLVNRIKELEEEVIRLRQQLDSANSQIQIFVEIITGGVE